jgi:hypothetical protein
LIGSPVAFSPVPSPHFDAGPEASGTEAELPLLPLSSSSPHAARNAGIAKTTQSSAASDRDPFQRVFLRTDPPPEI